LAKLLFGVDAVELLWRCGESRLVVIHDVPSSKIPFELLTAGSRPVSRPAVDAAMNRRPAPKSFFPCADGMPSFGRQHRSSRVSDIRADTAESKNLALFFPLVFPDQSRLAPAAHTKGALSS
jgi:hypothetical protein